MLQRSHHLLREAARRHSIHLVALNQRALLPRSEEVEEAARKLRKHCAAVEVFRMPWVDSRLRRAILLGLSFFTSTPYDLNWLRSRALRHRLVRLAGEEAFDVIHVDTIGLVPYLEPFQGVPVVLNHHNAEAAMVRRRAEHEGGWARRIYLRRQAFQLGRLEQRFCGAVAVNLTVSDLDSSRLRECVPHARVRVVENGVDVTYFRPGVSGRTDGGGLVFAGTWSWYPNRDALQYLLFEIWPLLVRDDPARALAVVGRDPPPELVAAARDPRVTVPGWVRDVRPYLDSASIYICPIRVGGGTRLKVLDALAMAKPLVATRLAVEGLDLIEGRHYLAAESPRQFVEQIRRLEWDKDYRDRLGRAGRALVEQRYAWDVIGERLDEAYRLTEKDRSAAGLSRTDAKRTNRDGPIALSVPSVDR